MDGWDGMDEEKMKKKKGANQIGSVREETDLKEGLFFVCDLFSYVFKGCDMVYYYSYSISTDRRKKKLDVTALFRDRGSNVVDACTCRVIFALFTVGDRWEETSLLIVVVIAKVTFLSLVVSQVDGLARLIGLVIAGSVSKVGSKDQETTGTGLH